MERLLHRCLIPPLIPDVRLERAATAETPEHELLGDLLEAQAAKLAAGATDAAEGASAAISPSAPGSAATTVAESTLRVDATRIDAVMNLVCQLIIGKSMLHRTLTEFNQ